MKYSDTLSHLILQGIKKTSKNFAHGMGYHTDKHAVEVIDAVMEIVDSYPSDYFTQKEKNSLFVAAAWHDAVYIAGSHTNEADSASKFTWYHGCSETVDTDLVANLIRGTTVKDHLLQKVTGDAHYNELQNVLLDADLYALQLPYDEFLYRQILILKEHGLDEESLSNNYLFLKQFLELRPYIYRTKYSRAKWEHRARENIRQLEKL